MNIKQALKEARKRWGKTAAVRDGGPNAASTPEKRAAAKAALLALRAQCPTPESRKAQRREIERLQYEALRYRFSVGKIDLGLFFSVKGCGDSFAGCFRAIDEQPESGTAHEQTRTAERHANDYANDAIKAEQISRASGPENDLDCVGRSLKEGT